MPRSHAAVRGVNSDGVLKSLLSKGLIQDAGRAEGLGRPILYSTTPESLQHFGIDSLTELPPLVLPAEGEKRRFLVEGMFKNAAEPGRVLVFY